MVLACVSAVAAPVRAHPDLNRAVKLANEAEFDPALAAFDKALRSGTLTREELVVLLTERALVRFAVDRARGMKADLRYLALLAPDTELGQRAPPGMLVAWESAREQAEGPLGLKLSAISVPGGMRVRAEITGSPEPPDLSVRLAVRAPNEAWQTLDSREARYPAPSGGELEYYGELVGLGGVVLASAGSREDPLTHRVEGASSSTTVVASGGEPSTTRSGRSSNAKWWWIGGGGVVAVAAAVTLGVVLAGSKDSNQTLVEAPMVDL